MKYEDFWTMNDLFLDKNGDGIRDGISLFIDLPKKFMPEGLFDFMARLGFETTALSYNFFEYTNQHIHLSFRESEIDKIEITESNKVCIYYNTVQSCSILLQELAQSGLETQDSNSSSWEERTIKKVTDIWSISGFGDTIEASPHHRLNLGINIDPTIKSMPLFKEICHFVARAAHYSTSIHFPLSLNDDPFVLMDFKESQTNQISVPIEQQIVLEGNKEGVVSLLSWINRQKHWSDGGSFGKWEHQLSLEQKQESSIWLEEEWTTQSEVEKLYEVLSETKIEEGSTIEIFISEPYEIRKNIESFIKMKYPNIQSINVRSSFKPGFHWIKEEILPMISKDCIELKIFTKKEQNEAGLELPIRWIQELYPIDRYLVKELTQLDAESIQFNLMDEETLKTYEVVELLSNGEEKALGNLSVPISKIEYVVPNQFSYPTTSMFRTYIEGQLTNEVKIPTDREQFYLYYMEEFLPKLVGKIGSVNEGQGVTRPLFDRIELDVTMSEEEEKLGVDHERTSSMEALYEDLYFNTLDYFSEWGTQVSGISYDAPGGIHPYMHVSRGSKPKASIRVFKWNDFIPARIATSNICMNSNSSSLKATVNIGHLKKTISLEDVPQSLNMNSQLQDWLDQHPNIKVVYPATSYGGETIPVIEVYLKSNEEFESSLKLSLHKTTIVIEAGHHSNEVSSTPAALQLVEMVVQGQFGDLNKVNIVVIPMANPDGTKLLSKLRAEHPEWKHHAARYNAVGLEFAHIRYKETIFGEADVLPTVMKKWAPDVVADNHGIPAHEWIQPFAGYNSPPRFPVSYFLPNSKIYGIGRVSNEVNTELLSENLETIVQSIVSQFEGTDIEKENIYWKKRFIKYGHQWLPEIFPIEESENFNFYRNTAVTPTYPTVSILRYPEWVAADLISEAADEIVYGKDLDSCIEAQVLFNKGIIDVLQNKEILVLNEKGTRFRDRPIKL